MAPFFSRTAFKSIPADFPATDGQRLNDFGVSATLLHTPGHTRGSISIVMDDGDAIVGDVLMGGYIGGAFRPGKPNFHYFAEDPALAMRSLDRVLAVTRGKLHVGHGGPLAHADVTRWRAASIER
jgi:hydroxyacylglutathione hydrolase